MSSNNIENELVNFLAIVYSEIPWKKMRKGVNVWDVFNHRVRAAARKGTIQAFASKLCNYFGIQSLPLDTVHILESLVPDQEKALNLLYLEHIPICMKAIIKAKENKKLKGQADEKL